MDLPMLSLSFKEWCLLCHDLFRKEPRFKLLGSLYEELKTINPNSKIDLQHIQNIGKKFIRFLKVCKKSENGLYFIQPGRFLINDTQNLFSSFFSATQFGIIIWRQTEQLQF